MGWLHTFFLAVVWHLALFTKACADQISKNLTAESFDENLFPVLLSSSPLLINFLEFYDCNASEALMHYFDLSSNTYIVVSSSCDSPCKDAEISTKDLDRITLSNGLVLEVRSWRILVKKESDNVQNPMALVFISPTTHFNQEWNKKYKNIVLILSPTVILSILFILFKMRNPFRKERHGPSSRPGSPMVTECDVRYNHMNERVKIV